MKKEEIGKLIDKKIKENQFNVYSLIFLAISIFFASLIQIIVYYYSNTEKVVPTF